MEIGKTVLRRSVLTAVFALGATVAGAETHGSPPARPATAVGEHLTVMDGVPGVAHSVDVITRKDGGDPAHGLVAGLTARAGGATPSTDVALAASALIDGALASPEAASAAAARAQASSQPAVRVKARLPEPATWAMLILGFGAIGVAVRRRLRRSEEAFNERIRRIAAGEEE